MLIMVTDSRAVTRIRAAIFIPIIIGRKINIPHSNLHNISLMTAIPLTYQPFDIYQITDTFFLKPQGQSRMSKMNKVFSFWFVIIIV